MIPVNRMRKTRSSSTRIARCQHGNHTVALEALICLFQRVFVDGESINLKWQLYVHACSKQTTCIHQSTRLLCTKKKRGNTVQLQTKHTLSVQAEKK